ncbi:MAG: erythromycin esterase family protein, partial [Halobacteriales archaeon]|nr:erythromycin esterase family protein [Halobacteriales archaeon]
YSLWDSLQATLAHLERIGSDAAEAARQAIACFEPYAPDPHLYARHAAWVPKACRDEVVQMLAATRAGLAALPDHATEARLDAEQNAVVAHNAETYYRAWAQGGPASWNVRDRHMLETLERLLDHHTAHKGEPAKAIVWAHNTHVGDARATDMRDDGMVNLGQLAREAHPGETFLLGFSTHAGHVIAGRAWEAPMRRMPLPPARDGSLEARLHGSGGDRLLLLPNDFPVWQPVGHRAVGVVYAPEREAGNYVPTVVPKRYDALLHVDATTALEPLGIPAEPAEVPQTWPWNT